VGQTTRHCRVALGLTDSSPPDMTYAQSRGGGGPEWVALWPGDPDPAQPAGHRWIRGATGIPEYALPGAYFVRVILWS
jgi:hypothetical protein